MSGRIVRVAPRRYYYHNGLGAHEESSVTLADRIDVSSFDKVDLMVRIHAIEFGQPNGANPSEAQIKVMVLSDGYTPEAPMPAGSPFYAAVGELTLTPLSAAPGQLKLEQFTGPLGSMLMVVLLFKQDTAESLPLNAELSVDLVLKGAGPCHGCSAPTRANDDACTCGGRSTVRPAC